MKRIEDTVLLVYGVKAVEYLRKRMRPALVADIPEGWVLVPRKLDEKTLLLQSRITEIPAESYAPPSPARRREMSDTRARFEAWASDNGKWQQAVNRNEWGDYVLITTATYWMAWQAAIADLEPELMEQCRIIGMGAERELALQAKLDASERECKRLREELKSEGPLDVDALSNAIRSVDGWHSLGACELAEAPMPFLCAPIVSLAPVVSAESGAVIKDSLTTDHLTVVYRGIKDGDEARGLIEHPKAVAMSWSHAIHDRDAAMAKGEESHD